LWPVVATDRELFGSYYYFCQYGAKGTDSPGKINPESRQSLALFRAMTPINPPNTDG